VVAVSASGGPGKAGGGDFATVDIAKIQNEYKAKATVESDLKALQDKLDGALQRRDAMPFLSDEDHKELDRLKDKDIAMRTDAEKKKIDDLTTKGNTQFSEIKALQQKSDKDLTEADKKRIKEAEDIYVKAQQSFAAMKEDRDKKLKEFITSNSETLLKNVRQAVAKVAEQKSLSIVFNSELVLYAGVDITAPVIGELNKK